MVVIKFFTALATWVISLFGASIEQMVALAFLMPIVASMGGNAGMQTLAVTIRAIATKEFPQVILIKLWVKIFNRNIKWNYFCNYHCYYCSILVSELKLSLLIGISMVLNMIVAGLFGILVQYL